MVTWCGWHPEDLLAEPGIFFSWVCVCLCVQDLVHLGKHNLPQVEETLGGSQGSASSWESTAKVLSWLSTGAAAAWPYLHWPGET